jgi:diguanylate cyclase (GGDEF)-like protein
VDLDDFKEVNDVFGHKLGDDLLVEVGRRLEHCVRSDDTVARLGGDEFVIVLTGGQDPVAVAGRIVKSVTMPAYMGGGVEVRVDVSLGMSSTADGSLHGSELLRRADIALHAAKAGGKNRHESFHPDMMTDLLARTDLEAGLRRAVERREVLVHFQPITSTDDVSATQMEVLVRWQRPAGLVAPMDFIPAAERNGSIIGIGQEVLRQACTQLSEWLDASELRSMAVNVSAVQLRDEHFATRVLATLESTNVRPAQVVIEVTESVFMIPGNRVIEHLSRLRHHGVRISIDDFGTGYSSLGRLQDLPVDAIKVDKSFVDKIVTGTEDLPILNSMIDMAHNLGLHVTAEGVETDAQAAQLIRLGCDALQGYLFCRPQPAGDVLDAEERSAVLMREILEQVA